MWPSVQICTTMSELSISISHSCLSPSLSLHHTRTHTFFYTSTYIGLYSALAVCQRRKRIKKSNKLLQEANTNYSTAADQYKMMIDYDSNLITKLTDSLMQFSERSGVINALIIKLYLFFMAKTIIIT